MLGLKSLSHKIKRSRTNIDEFGLFYKMVDLSYFILFVGYNFAIKTPLKYIITPKQ